MRAKFEQTRNKNLWIQWTPQLKHGLLVIQIRLPKNREEYHLQSFPKEYYNQLLRSKDPETEMNNWLRIWGV